MAEAIFHVQGYTFAGGWVSEDFEEETKAVAFFDSLDWRDGDCVAELFLPDRREYKTLRLV